MMTHKLAQVRVNQIEVFCNETVTFAKSLQDAIEADAKDAAVVSGCLWELIELRKLMRAVHQHVEESMMDLRRL